MESIIWIEDFNGANIDNIVCQTQLLNKLGVLHIIDNSTNKDKSTSLLEKLEQLDLDNTQYILNENKNSFSEMINNIEFNSDSVFVTTAYAELNDEIINKMKTVLCMCERHGMAIPHSKIIEGIPEYTIRPYFDGECAIVRSSVLSLYYRNSNNEIYKGLEQKYSTFYATLFVLSLTLADDGYATVCANTAIENSEKNKSVEEIFELKLAEKEWATLRIRLEKKYRDYNISPAEFFNEPISKMKQNKKTLLYFMVNMGPVYNGTSIHAIGVLNGILEMLGDEWEVTVVCHEPARIFHNLDERFSDKCIIMDAARVTGKYYIGFVPFHMFGDNTQKAFSEMCVKMIYWPLDLIRLRSNYLSNPDDIVGHEFIMRYADGLLYFSESVKNDYNTYFNYVDNLKRIPQTVSYIVSDEPDVEAEADNIFADKGYYLIMGNMLLHKMIAPCLIELSDKDFNFKIVGASLEGKSSDNIYLLPSGDMSEEKMAGLYRNCKALIYPSIYEGFGLPPVRALNLGKHIFVMEMAVNHELEALAPQFKGKVHYIKCVDELPEKLAEFENKYAASDYGRFEINSYGRSWTDVGADCVKMINEVAQTPVDFKRLYERRAEMRRIK